MEYHNKIDINIEDLRKVKQQFVKNATNKIDSYLPEQDNSDSMKSQVALAVQDFIDRVLESSRESMNINGLLPDEPLNKAMENPSVDSEPFDHLLQQQVRQLYREVEEETLKLAKLRKDTPQQLRGAYQESFKQSFEDLKYSKSQLESQNSDQELDDEIEHKEEIFEKKVLSNLDDMINNYEETLRAIQSMKNVST